MKNETLETEGGGMFGLSIAQWSQEVHRLAKEKGWHDDRQSEDAYVERMCNNFHDEVCELHEAWRNNELHEQCGKPIDLTCLEEELADIVIRVFDSAARLGVDIERAIEIKHSHNLIRPKRHGGKRS